MSIKRIALCIMYAMIAMFVINIGTANAEDETIFNTQQIQTESTSENSFVTEGTVNAEGKEAATGAATDIVTEVQNTEQNISAEVPSGEPVIEQGAVSESQSSSENTEESKNRSSSSKKRSYTRSELRLLSALIYCEAGIEPYAGKVAVGIVVMNRKESGAYPNSVKGVIYQKFQFSPVRNGMLKKALKKYDAGKFKSSLHKQCIAAAKEALSGVKTVTYGGKKIDCSKFRYFSGSLKDYKTKIKGHRFR